MARIVIYTYLDVVTPSDSSNLTDEEFWKHIREEQKELEKNWTGWEDLD